VNLRKAARLQHRGNGVEALRLDETADHVGSTAISPRQMSQAPIRATLTGSRRCEAEGFSSCSSVPVLALCRVLVAAGFDPATPLEAWRGDVPALSIRTIGEGARLTVEDGRHGTPRFRSWRVRGCRAAPSALHNASTPVSIQSAAGVDPAPQAITAIGISGSSSSGDVKC
jgi:hypothetical protein